MTKKVICLIILLQLFLPALILFRPAHSATLEGMPLGVYTYLSNLSNNAKKTGLSLEAYVRKFQKLCKDSGLTTIYVGNTGRGEDEFNNIALFLSIADELELKVMLQPTGSYFVTVDLTPDEALRTAEQKGIAFLSEAKRRGLFAHKSFASLTLRVELPKDYVSAYSKYAEKVKQAHPDLPLNIVFNRSEVVRQVDSRLHDSWGIDFYPFQTNVRTGLRLDSKEVFRYFANKVGKRFEEGGNYRQPPSIVLQGSATVRKARATDAVSAPKWNKDLYWSKYFPPPGGIRGQVWASYLMGARGFFLFYAPSKATPVEQPGEEVIYGSLTPDLQPDDRWKEYTTALGFASKNKSLLEGLHSASQPILSKKLNYLGRVLKDAQNNMYLIVLCSELDGFEPATAKKPRSRSSVSDRKTSSSISPPKPYRFNGKWIPLGETVSVQTAPNSTKAQVSWSGGEAVLLGLQ